MVKRIEERRDDAAETYALKVPQYDPTTARHLSEQEFLDMFRDEAGALLALPRHKNLARFVNFDLAAKPKPVLVMELIRGHSLERLLRTRALTLELCFVYLGGILQGLAAMHRVGVAHLDVKPSNVILRDERTPVLVDFGLSGRNLRPGCGTPEYCAPEVLGVVPDGLRPEACPADMYAFACTALELLTGQLLFDATEETALITQHISHDGWPEALAQFAEISGLKTLAVILAACLRRDPRQRPGAEAVAAELDRFRASLPRDMPEWPLPLHGQRLGVSA
jgi:eukaryotic-like serine/threonine-protein kinase